jgi:maltose alpha-D-glucosyltransferase/alpha-amylase
VVEYLTIAPRYGTNEDAAVLIDAARSRGIRVIFDLVDGHTSYRHPWFQESADTPGDHRYIWSDRAVAPTHEWVPNQGRRGSFYRANFFPIQPALNFGHARPDRAEPWRQPVDAEAPLANRAALREIMSFWFDRGASGFRVDMASSLVKDDPGHVETAKLWGEMRAWIDATYPDCALLAEWGDPTISLPAGFHADFFLHFAGPALRSLWTTTPPRSVERRRTSLLRPRRQGLDADVPWRVACGRLSRRRFRAGGAAHRQPRLLPA